MNIWWSTGRVGNDPKVSQSSEGKTRVFFSFAAETPGREDPTWIDCAIFNDALAKRVAKEMKKGQQAFIKGTVNTYMRTTDTGKTKVYSIIVNHIELVPNHAKPTNDFAEENTKIDYEIPDGNPII